MLLASVWKHLLKVWLLSSFPQKINHLHASAINSYALVTIIRITWPVYPSKGLVIYAVRVKWKWVFFSIPCSSCVWKMENKGNKQNLLLFISSSFVTFALIFSNIHPYLKTCVMNILEYGALTALCRCWDSMWLSGPFSVRYWDISHLRSYNLNI